MPPFPKALSSVWSKLNWADHHIQQLDHHAFSIGRDNHEFIGTGEDLERGHRVYYLLRDPEIPESFALLTGNALQALRSALDHLAFALCVAGPGGRAAADSKIKVINFPISGGDAKDYGALLSRREVIALAKPGVEKALDAVQPYKGGRGELLSALSTLNNIDKHRLLLTAALQRPMRDMLNTKQFDPQIAAALRDVRRWFPFATFGTGKPLKARSIVYRVPLDTKPDEEMNLVFPVAINEPEVVPPQPIVELLDRMLNLIRSIVPGFYSFV